MKEVTVFDKQYEYDTEILALVTKLKIACNRNHIPMFISVCVKNNEKETTYKNDMIGAASQGIHLKDDKLVKFVNVLNGFDTVPSAEPEDWIS